MVKKSSHKGVMRSSQKGHHYADSLPISPVLIAKKLNKLPLLDPDPAAKELAQDDRVTHKAHRVPHDKLRAQPPVEEAKVARVSQQAVDAGSDEAVRVRLPRLHHVVEAGAGVQHGERAHRLAHDDEHQAQRHGEGVQPEGQLIPQPRVPDEAFDTGGEVGDLIGGPVGGEKEGRRVGLGHVAVGGGPELEEVEERQGTEEEGDAPERRKATAAAAAVVAAGEEEGDEPAGRGGEAKRKGHAKEKGAQGDARERKGLLGIETRWHVLGGGGGSDGRIGNGS